MCIQLKKIFNQLWRDSDYDFRAKHIYLIAERFILFEIWIIVWIKINCHVEVHRFNHVEILHLGLSIKCSKID